MVQWFSEMAWKRGPCLMKYIKKIEKFEKKSVEFWKLIGVVELRFGRQRRCDCVGLLQGLINPFDIFLSLVSGGLLKNVLGRIKAFVSDTTESPTVFEEQCNF